MENKINIAEILKDCPQGMELDCATWENVTFEKVAYDKIYIKRNNKDSEFDKIVILNRYGCATFNKDEKCIIFPKGKITWEGFQRPFKDGDILSYQFSGFENRSIYIYMYHPRMNTTYYVAVSGGPNSEFMINNKKRHALNSYNDTVRFATEEEKQKLFDTIKDHGYKWNAKSKTLEKLAEPRFKVGDRIKSKYKTYQYDITELTDTHYTLVEVEDKFQYMEPICEDKNWELVPNKFDINTLVPFESRVLARDTKEHKWVPAIWGYYDNTETKDFPYKTIGSMFKYCIPYKGNEHLLGTTNDCNNYYKTWE